MRSPVPRLWPLVALVLMVLTVPAAAQSSAALSQVDSLRRDLVSSRGFIRGVITQAGKVQAAYPGDIEASRTIGQAKAAETQLSKALVRLDALLASNLPGVPVIPPITPEPPVEQPPVEPPRPIDPVPPAQPEPPAPLEVDYVVIRPRNVELAVGETVQLCGFVKWTDGTTGMDSNQRGIPRCIELYEQWVAEGAPRDPEVQP